MKTSNPCVMYDRECIGCGECDRCDLDPEKICDNCMKCVNGDSEYRGILIDGVLLEHELDSKAPNHYKKTGPQNQ